MYVGRGVLSRLFLPGASWVHSRGVGQTQLSHKVLTSYLLANGCRRRAMLDLDAIKGQLRACAHFCGPADWISLALPRRLKETAVRLIRIVKIIAEMPNSENRSWRHKVLAASQMMQRAVVLIRNLEDYKNSDCASAEIIQILLRN